MPQCLLRHVVVVQPDKPLQGLLQILGAVEVVGVQYLAETSIEALGHAVDLRHLGLVGLCSLPQISRSEKNSCAPEG